MPHSGRDAARVSQSVAFMQVLEVLCLATMFVRAGALLHERVRHEKSPRRASKTPSSMVRMDTSKVPPPRSKTRMWCSPPRLSRP